MNIKITYNWLLEYLDTNADPYEIQKYLSLCGPSIERVEKIGSDYVFDIEITSNRIDTASVLGIAQEAAAILPMFNKKASIKSNPLEKYQFKNSFSSRSIKLEDHFQLLNIKIASKDLCSRFSAIVLSEVKIQLPPEFIKKRLINCGIKSINNVVDISNYLMLAFGQPVHIFDYDRVKKSVMIMRNSRKGEKIITLDEKEINLPGYDIVIEDGEGRLIDLCGIMGGLNSSVTNKTKKIILFVQVYNKAKIRKTIMSTAQRTVAATYFEKGLDEERVGPTLVYGVELLKQYAFAKISSKLYDIYPDPYKQKSLVIGYSLFDKLIGIKINRKTINEILQSLGFKINYLKDDRYKDDKFEIIIPSWRKNDVSIPEDLVEEVARIYGYHKLPNNLPPPAYVDQPKEFEKLFKIISIIKFFLKHLGLNEVVNYSMISKEYLEKFNLKIDNHLMLANTISENIEYMRTLLIPSLYKNIKDNTGKKDILKFFEIAKVYYRQKLNLPKEVYKLAIAINTDFFDLKGIVEALYKELNIDKDIPDNIIEKNGIYLIELDLQQLMKDYRLIPKYKPLNPYSVIKLDLTLELEKNKNYKQIKTTAFKTSKLLQKIELIDLYQNKATLRFYFNSPERNITEEEAKKELEKIKVSVKALV